MIAQILVKVLIGVAIGAAVGGTAYAIYKVLNKEQVKADVEEEIKKTESEEILHKAFDAKIKEKIKKGETHSLKELKEWENGEALVVDVRDKNKNTIISNIVITGDEIGDDIRVGSVIPLTN